MILSIACVACFFLVLIYFLLQNSKKKQLQFLTTNIQTIWDKYSARSSVHGLSREDFLLGLRQDQSLTEFSLLVKTIDSNVTQINFATINREYVFEIQNRKFKVSRKLSFNSKWVLCDENENEILNFESLGLLGLRHRFFNSDIDLKSKRFWSNLTPGYHYMLNEKVVGLSHPLFGIKNYGQVLVFDSKIPLEIRVFILAVNWKGL